MRTKEPGFRDQLSLTSPCHRATPPLSSGASTLATGRFLQTFWALVSGWGAVCPSGSPKDPADPSPWTLRPSGPSPVGLGTALV